MNLSNCNSYVANRLRQITTVDSSSAQCMRLRIGQCLQLLGGSLTFHFANLFFLFFFDTSIYLYKVTSFVFSFTSSTNSSLCEFRCFPHLKVLPKQNSTNSREESLKTTQTPELSQSLFNVEGRKLIGSTKNYMAYKSSPNPIFIPNIIQSALEMMANS